MTKQSQLSLQEAIKPELVSGEPGRRPSGQPFTSAGCHRCGRQWKLAPALWQLVIQWGDWLCTPLIPNLGKPSEFSQRSNKQHVTEDPFPSCPTINESRPPPPHLSMGKFQASWERVGLMLEGLGKAMDLGKEIASRRQMSQTDNS